MPTGNQLCPPQHARPLCPEFYTSEAGGFSKKSVWYGDIGCRLVGADENGDPTVLSYIRCGGGENLSKSERTPMVNGFENKTATLEMIGILLPFLMSSCLVGQHEFIRVETYVCI
jgi:hypothetical protein